jgi:ParB/RepB/Spo0J family partition protein
LRKISLSQIVSNGNIRENYSDIEELAASIKLNGQLEPILVKAMEPDANGIEQYEIVAGHRRQKALHYLCDKGDSFTTIDAVIVTGDRLTIQLVENLQRTDLTAEEREYGIFQMCKNGLSQKEVAARLSKTVEYISRNVSAHKIRVAAKESGIDASTLATGTLNEIQAAQAADYPALVAEVINNGGTLEAARAVMENYRVAHGKPANPQKEKLKPPESAASGLSDPLSLHTEADPVAAPPENNIEPNIDIDTSGEPVEPQSKKENKNPNSKKPTRQMSLDEFDPPHKKVDFNAICVSIIRYAKSNEAVVNACKVTKCDACDNRCVYHYKLESAKDILALLHSEL